MGAADHRPDGPPGRDLQPHARGLSRSAALRRHALPADGLRRGHHRPAIALRPGRAGPPLGSGRANPQVRIVGFPRAGARRAGPLPGLRRPGHDYDGNPGHSGRRPGAGHRRLRADVRPIDQLDGLHGQRRQPHVPGRRPICQRRVHPGPPDGHSRGRQAAADQRKRPRRRRPAVGAPHAARSPPAAAKSPRASGSISSKSAIRNTATCCRATSPRGRFSRSASRRD